MFTLFGIHNVGIFYGFFITYYYIGGWSFFPESEDFGRGFAVQKVKTNTDLLGEWIMFYDVKILSSQGDLIKIISGKENSLRHWKGFYDAEANKTLNSSGRKQVPIWVKKKLGMEYARVTSISA